jgi:hypothetical protein
MRTWTLIAVLAAGCGGDKKSEEKEEKSETPLLDQYEAAKERRKKAKEAMPPGEVNAQPQLTGTVNGAAVTWQSALAWARPDGTVELEVSSIGSSCERATGRMRDIEPGEEYFSAILARQLKPEGGFRWGVQQASYGAMTRAGGGVAVEVDGAPEPGKTLKVTLAPLEVNAPAFGDHPDRLLKVAGSLEAKGCAPPSWKEPPPPRPAAQAGSITVAGEKVAIAGAVIEQEGEDRRIVLSNGAASCDGFPHGDGEVNLGAHYTAAKADKIWQLDLLGAWFDGQVATQILDASTLTIEPNRVPAGATTVELTLSGTADVNGFPTTIEGKVTAQVCPAS